MICSSGENSNWQFAQRLSDESIELERERWSSLMKKFNWASASSSFSKFGLRDCGIESRLRERRRRSCFSLIFCWCNRFRSIKTDERTRYCRTMTIDNFSRGNLTFSTSTNKSRFCSFSLEEQTCKSQLEHWVSHFTDCFFSLTLINYCRINCFTSEMEQKHFWSSKILCQDQVL